MAFTKLMNLGLVSKKPPFAFFVNFLFFLVSLGCRGTHKKHWEGADKMGISNKFIFREERQKGTRNIIGLLFGSGFIFDLFLYSSFFLSSFFNLDHGQQYFWLLASSFFTITGSLSAWLGTIFTKTSIFSSSITLCYYCLCRLATHNQSCFLPLFSAC